MNIQQKVPFGELQRGTVRVEHRDRVERVGDGVGEGDRGQIMLGPVRHVLFYYKINKHNKHSDLILS